MDIILEIVIYLLVVLGLITVCFTFFNKFNLINTQEVKEKEIINSDIHKYARIKHDDEKIIINIKYKNIKEEELIKIKKSVDNGNYKNVYDIADEINYININKNKKKHNK